MPKRTPKRRAGTPRKRAKRGGVRTKRAKAVRTRPAKAKAALPPPPPATIEPVSAAEQAAYIETVIKSGEAASLDEQGRLPAGATHKMVEDDTGKVKVVRRRFSIS